MLISKYINRDFIPPELNRKVADALKTVNRFGLNSIPVFQGLSFIGNISREDLESQDAETKLSEIKDLAEFYYITENSSLFDAIQTFHIHDTNVLAVLNEELKYAGMLDMEDVITGLSATPFISEPGATMIVEIAQNKYSVSEISKIAESNNARIIGLFVIGYQDGKVRVMLKLISENLASVSETFERFDYTVIHKFFKDEREELVKDRFDMLMKFLDM